MTSIVAIAMAVYAFLFLIVLIVGLELIAQKFERDPEELEEEYMEDPPEY